MAKRIYFDSLWKKWVAGGTATASTLGIFLFTYLAMTGSIEITGYSEDTICAGTINNPCYAYINFTALEDVYIYPLNHSGLRSQDVPVLFQPDVQDWELHRSWGSSWRKIDLAKPWNKDVKYSIKFTEGKEYQVRLTVLKNDPSDYIKWTFGSLDPAFLSVAPTDIITKSYIKQESDTKFCVYRTTCNPTNLEYAVKLYPLIHDYKSKTINHNFEVQQEYKYLETIIKQDCTVEQTYNKINKTYDNISICVPVETIVPKTGLRWVSTNNYKWDSKQCYETRQCLERSNNLDSINTELHVPMFGYDLSEFTTINSSGYNQTINPYINFGFYDEFDGTVLNTGVWTILSGAPTVSDSVLTMDGSSTRQKIINTSGLVNTDKTEFTIRLELNDLPSSQRIINDVGIATDKLLEWWITSSGDIGYYDTGTQTACSSCVSDGDIIELTYDGTDVEYFVNGVSKHTQTVFYVINLNNYVQLDTTGATGGITKLDNYYIWNGTRNNFPIKTTVYGPYNSTGSFSITNIYSDCSGNSNFINISQNSTSFEETTNATQHSWGEQIYGFYNEVDTTECSWIFLEVDNATAPIYSCTCPVDGNWDFDCSASCSPITSDCSGLNYLNLTGTGTFDITDGALVSADVFVQDTNCDITIKNTGLLIG